MTDCRGAGTLQARLGLPRAAQDASLPRGCGERHDAGAPPSGAPGQSATQEISTVPTSVHGDQQPKSGSVRSVSKYEYCNVPEGIEPSMK